MDIQGGLKLEPKKIGSRQILIGGILFIVIVVFFGTFLSLWFGSGGSKSIVGVVIATFVLGLFAYATALAKKIKR